MTFVGLIFGCVAAGGLSDLWNAPHEYGCTVFAAMWVAAEAKSFIMSNE